jgi:hypothetical protein
MTEFDRWLNQLTRNREPHVSCQQCSFHERLIVARPDVACGEFERPATTRKADLLDLLKVWGWTVRVGFGGSLIVLCPDCGGHQ